MESVEEVISELGQESRNDGLEKAESSVETNQHGSEGSVGGDSNKDQQEEKEILQESRNQAYESKMERSMEIVIRSQALLMDTLREGDYTISETEDMKIFGKESRS